MKKMFIFPLLLTVLVLLIHWRAPGGLPGAWVMAGVLLGTNQATLNAAEPLPLQAMPGFQVSLYAEDVGHARFMALSDSGDLLVTLPASGEIVRLRDSDGDGVAESKTVLLSGLDRVQGIDFSGNWLYFSQATQIHRVRFDHQSGELDGQPELLIDQLPAAHGHASHDAKPMAISPDGRLFYNIGSPCNICEPEDERFSTMQVAGLDGSNPRTYASGLRNSVAFDWAPWSGELYATDNARDLLGDDFPPDEVNRIVEGGFYGWPYFHGDNVPDPKYGENGAALADRAIPPAFSVRPHNAPLGIHFIRNSKLFPKDFERAALVALHGSWNRSELDGYKVIALFWQADGSIQTRDFLTGFLTAEGVIGRPVEIVENKAGELLISDDLGGRIYRVALAED